MSSVYRMLVSAVVFTLVLTFHPRMAADAKAQTPPDCEVCEDGVGEHRFLLNSGILCDPESPDEDCRACDNSEDLPDEWFCHSGWLSGSCAFQHLDCGLHFAQADQQGLLEAVEARNVSEVADVLGQHQGTLILIVNRERNAIQWRNCQGALAGHLPLGSGVDAFLAQVAERLQTMQSAVKATE